MSGALSAPSASPDHPPAQQAAAGYGPPAEPACTLQRVEQPTGYGCQQDQECSTSYEQECQTTYAQQCENVYEQKCETKERRQSLEQSIVWRWPSHKSTFLFMFSLCGSPRSGRNSKLWLLPSVRRQVLHNIRGPVQDRIRPGTLSHNQNVGSQLPYNTSFMADLRPVKS